LFQKNPSSASEPLPKTIARFLVTFCSRPLKSPDWKNLPTVIE